MKRNDLNSEIKKLNGKFFTVIFTKKDGSTRKMTARTGVVKHLKGGTNKATMNHPEYLTVFDMANLGYRTVNLNTVHEIHMNHQRYTVE